MKEACAAISPDLSPQPPTHPPLSPADGAISVKNPPALTWRVDARAASYSVEMAPDPGFGSGAIRVDDIDMPFYNGSTVLAEGAWYWRYSVVLPDGRRSHPSPPRSFRITINSVPLPVPPTPEILSGMPDHPRVFVTPDTLDAFRSLRDGPSGEAWRHLRRRAEALLDADPLEIDRLPMPADPGEDRGQIFGVWDGAPCQPAGYDVSALKSSTGLDLFREPRWRNSGDFWLYCMSMNYWWNHWGDCYSLIDPNLGSDADTYISGLLASQTRNRYVKWYGETRVCNPVQLPFWYLSGSDLAPKPPVDIPQARVFPEVGQLAAYDRFYDHGSNRIFFRSSPWGSHSHSHRDQNGFVLHAGGEIMACDAGYYTYSGDDYSGKWSQSTAAHNSLLVDGEGQPKGIDHKGRIVRFFDTPHYCLFTGDARDAYEGRLEAFDRTIVFIRPDIWILHDSVRAPRPSRFTWTLNTFEAADIHPDQRKMVVKQRNQRLDVHHVTPEKLDYTQNNDRPFPMRTRAFTRFTEAFPQQWNIRVTTTEVSEDGRILSLLHAYDEAGGPGIGGISEIRNGDTLGVRYEKGDAVDLTLFRGTSGDPISAERIESDAEVISLRLENGRPVRYLVQNGMYLRLDGEVLWQSDGPCGAAVSLDLDSTATQVAINGTAGGTISLPTDRRPRTALLAPPNRPSDGRPVEAEWDGGLATVRGVDPGEQVLWIDPVADLSRNPDPISLALTDSRGTGSIDLETARADNGDTVAFARIGPDEPGVYEIAAGEGVEILVQDAWDPDLRSPGLGTASATLREATEVFFRYPPTVAPTPTARLTDSSKGNVVSLLANGGFEAGIPDYPPRGWNVTHPRTDDLGWPEWSQDGPAEGRSCLRFFRPKDRISLVSRPMRLRRGGPYVLSFKARGSATHACVIVSGQFDTRLIVPIEPGAEWSDYRAELEAAPGYCTVTVAYDSGGAPDQVLYLDDVQFGYIA